MTAPLLARAESDAPIADPVTFLLHRDRLVTLRYIEPRAFDLFSQRAQGEPLSVASAEAVLAGLLDAVVDRLADALEFARREIDRISHSVFRAPRQSGNEENGLQHVLTAIGRNGQLLSLIRESITGLQRLVLFWQHNSGRLGVVAELADALDTLRGDLASLADHAAFLAHDVNFLLDATLGFINIEQNHIIKIFSVLAVLFLPPTLVASIYGMNFESMPELSWPFGYPLALALMVLSAALPWRWFRRRGWL
jgi:magnesium transporter